MILTAIPGNYSQHEEGLGHYITLVQINFSFLYSFHFFSLDETFGPNSLF